nr:archaeal proteasome endopeptidase complex subunit beta [Pyrodictium occultum]
MQRRLPGEERLAAALEKGLHGTTTVGLRVRDYVVLAADRRATAGYYVAHKRTRKIIRIADYMAVTTAGLVADAQMLAEWLSSHLHYYSMVTGKRMSVSAAAQYLAAILHSSRLYPYIVQLLLGGYDDRPRLYNIDWFGSMTEERYVATGSGSPTAIGVIEDGYREDMSLEDAVSLARRAVLSATRRDAFSGNGIDIVAIGKGFYQEYHYTIEEALKLERA